MYLLIAVGLAVNVWPGILSHEGNAATPSTAVSALLGAIAIMCLAGLRFPTKMIPILIFELIWKILWVAAYAIPAWLNDQMDAYTRETVFACMMGVVLVPCVLPWGYIRRTYLPGRGDPWRPSIK
jgi:hypothetical protein